MNANARILIIRVHLRVFAAGKILNEHYERIPHAFHPQPQKLLAPWSAANEPKFTHTHYSRSSACIRGQEKIFERAL